MSVCSGFNLHAVVIGNVRCAVVLHKTLKIIYFADDLRHFVLCYEQKSYKN